MIDWVRSHGYYFLALLPFAFWALARGSGDKYSGKLIGVVGKMGSGKSLFAVRMAYRRMSHGANVRTNFTMNFPIHHEGECPPKCEKKKRCVCVRKKKMKAANGSTYKMPCLCQMKKRWAPFYGWEELAFLENAVVIVDEAHLMAPSHDFHAIPEIARWKVSMGRKFHLDVYWISQNEKKISAQLRNDTHSIYLCRSWFEGMGRGGAPLVLTAKEYEPESMRKKDAHIGRRLFKFNLGIAELYDTLEVMRSDKLVSRDGTMALADEITKVYNDKRGLTRTEREHLKNAAEEDGLIIQETEDGKSEVLPGTFGEKKSRIKGEKCGAITKKGTPCLQPASRCPFHKGEQEKGENEVKKGRQFQL